MKTQETALALIALMASISACTNETEVATEPTESASAERASAESTPAQSSPPPLLAEPVVGVEDPESLFVDDDPLHNRNKQTTLHIMRELLQCNQWDRAGEWLTDAYHQHNPNAASGLQGVVFFFTQVLNLERVDECSELTTEIVAVMADDDYVTVLWPRTYPDPRDPANASCLSGPPGTECAGQMYTTSWFDTWRFVDGKADEHWDPATIPAPPQN